MTLNTPKVYAINAKLVHVMPASCCLPSETLRTLTTMTDPTVSNCNNRVTLIDKIHTHSIPASQPGQQHQITHDQCSS